MHRNIIEQDSCDEEILSSRLGLVLIKPDAVELDIAEFIISHITQILNQNQIAELNSVNIIKSITSNQIASMYPTLPDDGKDYVISYLMNGQSVLVTWIGNGNINLWETIKKIKGRRMNDWTTNELDGGISLDDSIRGILPIPGTTNEYTKVIERIKQKKIDPNVRFDDDEFRTYCRNLVHSPDNLEESIGLLSLLPIGELEQVLNPEIFTIVHKYI